MRLEKLPSGSYRVRKMVNGVKYTILFDHKPSEREITLAIAERLQDSTARSKGTFYDYCKRYVDSKRNILSPASVRTYDNMCERLSDELKNKNIYDITQEDIQKEINEYSIDHAPKTTRSYHGFIASVIGMYRPQFTLNTALPRRSNEKGYQPTTDDIKRVLNAVNGTKLSIPFQLGVLGLRRGEICALTLDDIKGNELTVSKTVVFNQGWQIKQNAKTDTSNRTIVIPDKLLEEINNQGYIYERDPKGLNKNLQRILKELDIPTFRFHDLRHYFASYASTLDIPEADIMAMGGWKTDHVFKTIYRDSMEKSRKNSMKKIADNIL